MNRRDFIRLTGAAASTITAAIHAAPLSLDIVFATGLKNANGHIYIKEAWESAIGRAKEHRLFLTLSDDSGQLRLDQVCGIVESVKIEPDPNVGYRASARVKGINTPAGDILKRMCSESCVFMASTGIGGLNDDGMVHSYSISHFFVTNNPAFTEASPIRME